MTRNSTSFLPGPANPEFRRTPETIQRLIEATEQGATLAEAARAVGINEWTLKYWQRDDPAFHAQMMAARVRSGRHPGANWSVKLNNDVHLKIVDAIGRGMTRSAAAAEAAISPTTLRDWLERGNRAIAAAEQADEGEEVPESEERYMELARDVAAAQARFKSACLTTISNIGFGLPTQDGRRGNPQWQALAWMMERMFPEEFALRNRLEHTGADGGAIRTTNPLQEEMAKLVRERTEQLAEQRLRDLESIDGDIVNGHHDESDVDL